MEERSFLKLTNYRKQLLFEDDFLNKIDKQIQIYYLCLEELNLNSRTNLNLEVRGSHPDPVSNCSLEFKNDFMC